MYPIKPENFGKDSLEAHLPHAPSRLSRSAEFELLNHKNELCQPV